MPYPNEHSARLQSPTKFDKFRRTSGNRKIYFKILVPKSVGIIWGHPKGMPPRIWVPQSLRFPTKNWTVAAAKKWLSDNKIKYQRFEPASKQEKTKMNVKRLLNRLFEQEVSTRSWASINKSKLPASCFLWVPDPKKKTTWKLPYREGAGGIDPKTGMYRKAGPININAIRAIMASLGGAHTGKPMRVPASVRAKAIALAKKYKIGKYKENMFQVKTLLVAEVFVSLRDALEKAVRAQFGADYYVVDFSNKEVIFYKSSREGEISVGEVPYKKVSYKIVKGEIEFVGTPMDVKRVVRYENRLSSSDLIELIEYSAELRNKEK